MHHNPTAISDRFTESTNNRSDHVWICLVSESQYELEDAAQPENDDEGDGGSETGIIAICRSPQRALGRDLRAILVICPRHGCCSREYRLKRLYAQWTTVICSAFQTVKKGIQSFVRIVSDEVAGV